MRRLIQNLLDSFSNNKEGWSGKKLTAFAITMAYCYSHRYCDAGNLAIVLGVDAGFIAVLFGINVVDKNKNPMEEKEEIKPQGERIEGGC